MSTESEVFTSAPPTGETPATDDTAPIPEAKLPKASGRSPQNVFIDEVMKRLGERGFGPRAQLRRLIVAQSIPWVEAMETIATEAIASKAITAYKLDGTLRTKGGTFFETAKQALLAEGMTKAKARKIFHGGATLTTDAMKVEIETRIREVESGEVETIPAEQVFAEMDAMLAQRDP